jgi:hypothetical protein
MGHSGILDTGVLVMRGNGLEVAHYPGIALQFEKMIDEHSAIYSVMTATDNTTIAKLKQMGFKTFLYTNDADLKFTFDVLTGATGTVSGAAAAATQ